MVATLAAVTLEQALFTSLQSGQNEGYQIAGHSPGLTPAWRRELTAWAPSHDSLQPGATEIGSINFHMLADGAGCLSLTRPASEEYSGRGTNIATWMLVAAREALATFGSHPLRLLDAALAAGWTHSGNDFPALELVGRAREVNLEAICAACDSFEPEALALIVDCLRREQPVGVTVARPVRLVVDAVLSLLPLEARWEASFTTGLHPTMKRTFRLHLLTPLPEVTSQFTRAINGQIVDPHRSPGKLSKPAQELAGMLKQQRWCELRRRVLNG